ncbi:MAG: GspH/FimT family pseudopilin [candidate division Zixibacteria bacterium]|nr:GspH/FimT family pseudopilin [candidate division Zixibacteria bacterium]
MMAKLTSRRGITLVELMATVVIIGIVAAMATPHFDRAIDRIKFRSQTKNLVSMLRTARSNAIAEKAPYGVVFDFGANTITMFRDSTNIGSNTYEAGSDSVITADTLLVGFSDCSTTFPNSAVVFQPNGSASSSGDVDLHFESIKEASDSRVNVLASTGRSKVMYITNSAVEAMEQY